MLDSAGILATMTGFQSLISGKLSGKNAYNF